MSSEVFDRIAPGWYNFRHHTIFRAELEELAERWWGGSLLNLGCGHGADFLPFIDGFKLYGVDFSREMLRLAERYAAKFGFSAQMALGDVCELPFREGAFDNAIAAAAYHHIDKERQNQALGELLRVLKPGGEAFVTAWNGWQPRFWFKGKETEVPWQAGKETLQRYYYLFSYPELARLARGAGFEILRSFPERSYRLPLKYFSRNICLLLKKPA